jgi:hypothetical protein
MAKVEHFTGALSFAAATGLALVLAGLGLQASNWPHFISIGAFYGAGAVLFLGGAIPIAKSYLRPNRGLTVQDDDRPAVANTTGQNSGRLLQTGAIGSYYEAPVIPVPALPEPVPEISFIAKVRLGPVYYHESPGYWLECRRREDWPSRCRSGPSPGCRRGFR